MGGGPTHGYDNSNNNNKPREISVIMSEADMNTATQHAFSTPSTEYSCLEIGKIYMNPFTVSNAKSSDLIYQNGIKLSNKQGKRTWDKSRLVITTDGSVYFMPRLYSCYRYDSGDYKRNYFDIDYYTTVKDEGGNKWEETNNETYAFIID